ncbi:MAG TPA: nitroreductase family protein [Thermoguttaceae bacterium]|nr:nitroreductase family protein [Thermoguttaceae bacterium]
MNLRNLLTRNRSYRRFRADQPIVRRTLVELVELTRLCPSAANRQPLRYLIVHEPADNARVFARLAWARALKGWTGPAENERPAGYIIILGDTRITDQYTVDAGIAAQSILLGAVERGLGGCILGSIDRDGLRRDFHIPEHFGICLVLALGTPGETVVLEDVQSPAATDYWRDEQGVHHVPKRTMDELLVRFDPEPGP